VDLLEKQIHNSLLTVESDDSIVDSEKEYLKNTQEESNQYFQSMKEFDRKTSILYNYKDNGFGSTNENNQINFDIADICIETVNKKSIENVNKSQLQDKEDKV